MTPAQIRAVAQNRFEEEADALGKSCHWHRLFDTGDLMNRGARGHASLPRNPADYIVNLGSDMFYAEVKGIEKGTSFSFARFEPAQWGAMRALNETSGAYRYYVLIWHIGERSWYSIPSRSILKWKDAGYKSISFKTLDNEGRKYDQWCSFHDIPNRAGVNR